MIEDQSSTDANKAAECDETKINISVSALLQILNEASCYHPLAVTEKKISFQNIPLKDFTNLFSYIAQPIVGM